MNAGQTPVEAEFMVEVSDAVLKAGLDRSRASEMLVKLAEKLSTRQPRPGYTIQECYDLVNHRPSPEFQKIYMSVKEELSTMGLDFS